jgi:predicted O-methyltransferase YrrM
MEHFYQDIPGWFSYEYVYKDLVEQADDDSLFVEIGSYKGMSSAYMAVEIINSGKNIKFECIDPMELNIGSWSCNADEQEGYSEKDFHARLESVEGYYKLHKMTSDEAVNQYEDGTIDFLMVDGDHSYEAVKKDILNYLPKMRSGGLIVLDDSYEPGIQQAIAETVNHLDPVNTGVHCFISIP